ncbi:MAG TPA: ABC transporter permease, partial [Blastocatellia bacterium]
MQTLWQDLRYGARMLLKNPGFTLIAVITLSLGIGANTAIFTIVNAVLLRPLPYPESERLMEVGRAWRGDESVNSLSPPKFIFLRDNCQSFDAIAGTQWMGANFHLYDESQSEYISGSYVTADFFRVLGVSPANGRSFTAEEDSPAGERVVILGDGLWRRRFGADAGIIGRTITLNGAAYAVIGIMPPGFEYYGPQEVILPMRVDPASRNEGHNWRAIGRLKHGVTQDQARAELESLFDRFHDAYPRQVNRGKFFGAMDWRASMTRESRDLLWILFGAVGFVLLIA